MKKFRIFIDSFIPSELLEKESVELCRYRTLLKFSTITFFVMALYLTDSFYKELFGTAFILIIFTFLNFIVFYTLTIIKNYRIASHLYCTSSFLLFFGINYVSGFHLTPQLSWFLFFPLLTANILGKKSAFRWTVFVALSIPLTLLVFKHYNFPLSPYPRDLLFESTVTDLFLGPFLAYTLVQSAYAVREIAVIEMEEANQKLSIINQDKRLLLSILFHDLSNHLTLANLSVNSKSLAPNGDEKSQKYLNNIKKSLGSMSEIISNVREQEKVKSGKQKIKLEKVSLIEAFDSISFLFHSKLQQKNINFIFENDQNVYPFVIAEKVTFFNNVLNNFISNAIKFSHKNAKIIMRIEDYDKDFLKISITDFGIGIPESLIPFLFHYEKPTSRAGTDNEEGSGFGLPIVKSIIERFDGELKVKSKSREDGHENSFSTFSIILKKAKK